MILKLNLKHKKIKDMWQTVDYPHTEVCKIILLSEKSYRYEEIRRQIHEYITKGTISKFLKRYKIIMSLQIKVVKTGKCV